MASSRPTVCNSTVIGYLHEVLDQAFRHATRAPQPGSMVADFFFVPPWPGWPGARWAHGKTCCEGKVNRLGAEHCNQTWSLANLAEHTQSKQQAAAAGEPGVTNVYILVASDDNLPWTQLFYWLDWACTHSIILEKIIYWMWMMIRIARSMTKIFLIFMISFRTYLLFSSMSSLD